MGVNQHKIGAVTIGIAFHKIGDDVFDGIAVFSVLRNAEAKLYTVICFYDTAFSGFFREIGINVPVWDEGICTVLVGYFKIGNSNAIGADRDVIFCTF